MPVYGAQGLVGEEESEPEMLVHECQFTDIRQFAHAPSVGEDDGNL
jgi:hypothetical protein